MPGVPMLVVGWRLGDRLFGVEVRNVVHIEEHLRERSLPRPVPGISGLMFYRGQMVPVLDTARILLDEPRHVWPAESKHLILQTRAQSGTSQANSLYAGRVDAVIRIFTVTTDDLKTWERPPGHPAVPLVRALIDIEGEAVWLVDVRRIVRHVRRRREPDAPATGEEPV